MSNCDRTIWISMALASVVFVFAPAALAGEHKDKVKHHGMGHERMEDAKQRAEEAREQAEGETQNAHGHAKERMEKVRKDADMRSDKARDDADEAVLDGKGRGDEMRARRDERKEVMADAKSAAEPGTPRKGKKPWWRFWESDADASDE